MILYQKLGRGKVIGRAGKRALKRIDHLSKFADNVMPYIDNMIEYIQSNTLPYVKDLARKWAESPASSTGIPRLVVNSTKSNGKLVGQVNKHGMIAKSGITKFLENPMVSPFEKFLVTDILENKYKDMSKLNFKAFQQDVAQELFPLYRKFGELHADYGISRLGYHPKWDTKHATVFWHNEPVFGTNREVHLGFPDNAVGHSRFFIDNMEDDVYYLLENQSDLFQSKMWRGKSVVSPEIRLENAKRAHEKSKFELEKAATERPDWVDILLGLGDLPKKNAEAKVAETGKLLKEVEHEVSRFTGELTQERAVGDFHFERQLQENTRLAADMGKKRIRIPTKETAFKIQDYGKVKDKSKYEGILRKYDQIPKTIKQLFNTTVTPVLDRKGNTWYEFDIPAEYINKTAEIRAFHEGGTTKI